MVDRFAISAQSNTLPTPAKGLIELLLNQRIEQNLSAYLSLAQSTPSSNRNRPSHNTPNLLLNVPLAKGNDTIKVLQVPLPRELSQTLKNLVQQPFVVQLKPTSHSSDLTLAIMNKETRDLFEANFKQAKNNTTTNGVASSQATLRILNEVLNRWLQGTANPLTNANVRLTQFPLNQMFSQGAASELLTNKNSRVSLVDSAQTMPRSNNKASPNPEMRVLTNWVSDIIKNGSINHSTPPFLRNFKAIANAHGAQIPLLTSTTLSQNKGLERQGVERHPLLLKKPIALSAIQYQYAKQQLLNDLKHQQPVASAINRLIESLNEMRQWPPRHQFVTNALAKIAKDTLTSIKSFRQADTESLKTLMKLSGLSHEKQLFDIVKPLTISSRLTSAVNQTPHMTIPDAKHLFSSIRMLLAPLAMNNAPTMSLFSGMLATLGLGSKVGDKRDFSARLSSPALNGNQILLLTRLKQDVEGAATRIRLNQLANVLSNDPSSMTFELPIFFRQQCSTVQLKWQLETEHPTKNSTKKQWVVTIRFEFSNTGPFQARVQMNEKTIDVRFVAEKVSTQTMLAASMDELANRLVEAGLMRPSVSFENGACPDLVTSNAQQEVNYSI